MTAESYRLTRRRFLSLMGATAGVPLSHAWPAAASDARILDWRGRMLGADSRILLAGLDRASARGAIARCLEEVDRLEAIFSLYRPESEICRLNRDGALPQSSLDLRYVLGRSLDVSQHTNGAFDVTVQPLWRLFATRPGGEPTSSEIERAKALVDYRAVEIDGATVAFARRDMAITLNGAAQGYISDRIAAILQDAGIEQTLVQMGETRALTPPPGLPGWPVRLPDESDIALVNESIATSMPRAETLGKDGGRGHILDPRTGLTPFRFDAVSVVAPSALTADILSTALSVLPNAAAHRLLHDTGATKAIYLTPDGRTNTVWA